MRRDLDPARTGLRELERGLRLLAEDLLDRVPEARVRERVQRARQLLLIAAIGEGEAAVALRNLEADLAEGGRVTRNAEYHAAHLRRAAGQLPQRT